VVDIPLSQASFTEVLARVSFRCIHLFRRRYDYGAQDEVSLMFAIHDHLYQVGFDVLAVWVRAYQYHWAPLYSTTDIRADLILRSRAGYSWRRVVYPPYKSGRRDPRVTNRGVTSRHLDVRNGR
jgi:hypothetical protein